MCVGFTADAQKATKPLPKKSPTKSKQIQKAATTIQTGTSALKKAPTTSESTSTTNLRTAIETKKGPVRFSFLTFHDVSKKSIHDSDPSAYGIWRPTVHYALADHLSLSYIQEFQNFYGSTTSAARWQINDGRLQIVNSKIAKLPGDIGVDGFFRAYIPIGESTRFKNKRHTAFYGNLNASRPFGKLNLTYSFLAMYQVNSQDYYLNTKPNGETTPEANVDFIIENYVNASYTISPKVSASLTTGFADLYFRGVPVKGVVRDTSLYSEASMNFNAIKNVSLSASIFNQTSLMPNNDFKYFADAETYYRALVNISL